MNAAPIPVQVLGLPVALYRRSNEHGDALRRELSLMAGQGGLRELGEAMQAYNEAAARVAEGGHADQRSAIAEADHRGEETVDLTYPLRMDGLATYERLAALYEEVEERCRAGREVMTLAAPDDVNAFRRWFMGEFTRQAAGETPVPWAWVDPASAGRPVSWRVLRTEHDVVLELRGDIDLETAVSVRRALAHLRERAEWAVTVDAAGITFLDSVGISVLVAAARRLADDGGRLLVARPSDAARETLELAGVGGVLGLSG